VSGRQTSAHGGGIQPAIIVSNSLRHFEGGAVPKHAGSNAKPTVLAVDDKAPNLMALEAVLHDDCHVIRALSGAEALAIL
jgi:PleD family two-component response regulator